MEKIGAGKHEDAAKMQHSVQTLARLVTRNGVVPPVKAALKMIGIDAGKSRMPLDSGGTLGVELKEEIRVELEKLGVIDNLAHPSITENVDIIIDDDYYQNAPRDSFVFNNVKLIGNLYNGLPIWGEDTVLIIKKGKF